MKKLTFAFAVASAFAVFAEGDGVLNSIGFEDYTAGFSGLSLKSDAGAEGTPSESYWLGSAEDASTVKAYGGDNLAAPTGGNLSGTLGNNYLELSTEGGTLWRSINTLTDAETLGDAINILDDTDSGELYIDTMVQFTPTEDGGEPELDATADKLAIWLNVDSSGNEPVTNLCVRAGYIDDQAGVTPTTYVIQNATVDAGSWYRLTVKAVPDITAGDEIPGFIVYLDGTKLVADKRTLDEAYTESDDLDGEIEDFAVFASLLGSGDPTLQAVGFKGSGAIDDLVFTAEDPLPAPGGADWPTATGWAQDADAAVKAKFADWVGASAASFEGLAPNFLMNLAANAEVPELTIESITVDGDEATVVVGAEGVELDKINGVLYVESSNDLANWAAAEYDVATAANIGTDGKATFTVQAGKFIKAKIGFKDPVQQ